MGNARYLGLLVAVLVPLVAPMAFGANVSAISFNETHLTIQPNSTVSVGYSVDLINGTSGLTNFTINNLHQLESDGIAVNASNQSGYPDFSGLLTIRVSNDALPGNYSVIATATGATPSRTSNAFPFVVPGNSSSTVPPPQGAPGRSPSNSSRSGTSGAVTLYTTSTSGGAGPSTAAVTTTQPSASLASEWPEAAAAVIIILIISGFVLSRMNKNAKGKV